MTNISLRWAQKQRRAYELRLHLEKIITGNGELQFDPSNLQFALTKPPFAPQFLSSFSGRTVITDDEFPLSVTTCNRIAGLDQQDWAWFAILVHELEMPDTLITPAVRAIRELEIPEELAAFMDKDILKLEIAHEYVYQGSSRVEGAVPEIINTVNVLKRRLTSFEIEALAELTPIKDKPLDLVAEFIDSLKGCPLQLYDVRTVAENIINKYQHELAKQRAEELAEQAVAAPEVLQSPVPTNAQRFIPPRSPLPSRPLHISSRNEIEIDYTPVAPEVYNFSLTDKEKMDEVVGDRKFDAVITRLKQIHFRDLRWLVALTELLKPSSHACFIVPHASIPELRDLLDELEESFLRIDLWVESNGSTKLLTPDQFNLVLVASQGTAEVAWIGEQDRAATALRQIIKLLVPLDGQIFNPFADDDLPDIAIAAKSLGKKIVALDPRSSIAFAKAKAKVDNIPFPSKAA
jgi:hypothetical protein